MSKANETLLLKDLYSKSKRLNDDGNLIDGNGKNSLDDLPALEIAVSHEDVAVADRFRIDVSNPISVKSLAEEKKSAAKNVLEQILDFVFSSEPGKDLKINFGALLREYSLTYGDVERLQDYLGYFEGHTIRIQSILEALFCRPSEVEVMLASLYANLSYDVFKSQYNAATHIPVAEIQAEDVANLTDEFDEVLAKLQSRENMEDLDVASLDAEIAKAMQETNSINSNIDKDSEELQQALVELKKRMNDIEITKCDHLIVDFDEITTQSTIIPDDQDPFFLPNIQTNFENDSKAQAPTAFAQFAADHASDVLPRLPRNAHLSTTVPASTRPKPSHHQYASSQTPPTISFTAGADVTMLHKEIVDDTPIPLCPDRPSFLPPPAVGDPCLALRGKIEWMTATFTGLSTAGWATVVFPDGESATVPKEDVAYSSPPSWFMEVEERIVAQFERKRRDGEEGYYMRWMSAIVAEQPLASRNKARYLIFSSDGDARYVNYADIRCCLRQSKLPIFLREVSDPSIADYLKRVMKNLPEKALVRLKMNETVKMLRDKKLFIKCRVEEIDCAMAKLRLPSGKVEWVYRGDWRLEPIFEQHHSRSMADQSRIRRHHSRHGPPVEFVGGDSDDDGQFGDGNEDGDVVVMQKLPTARKRTSAARGKIVFRDGVRVPPSNAATPGYPILRKNEIVEFYRRNIPHRSPEMITDQTSCDVTCLGSNSDPQQHKNESPFLIPMICGWQRETEQTRTRRSRISYIPPCEHRRLRHEKELQEFLAETGCQLTVDLFDFDPDFDPYSSIRCIEPFVLIEDFTGGRENVRIQCVNGITKERPMFPHYESRRFTTDPSVDLNGAKAFISGCDCTDNCSDPKRCQCQQLTIVQASGGKSKIRSAGYRYRRLPDGQIATGIYECNSNCKCNCRCPNRVVQQPLLNRLQLFKTPSKGWGVRCLDGIPKGAFICIYAGNVLSDQAANVVGQQQGDEYFADLDLIMCAERLKEGYEEDGPLDTGSDEEDENGHRKRRKASRGNGSDDETSSPTRGAGASYASSSADGMNNRMAGRNWSMSEYLGGDENCVYILDAKCSGNVGRYLNHSCDPNVFVQNVFVDTHDMRLPWVAFFASETIKAGTELCWDYRYTPMEDRPMACNCGAKNCRKRLL